MTKFHYIHKYEESVKYKGRSGQYLSKRKVKTVTKVQAKHPSNRPRAEIKLGTLVALVAAVLQVAAKLMGSDERRKYTTFIGTILYEDQKTNYYLNPRHSQPHWFRCSRA